MKRLVTLLAAGSLVTLGFTAPSMGQLRVYIGNPNQQNQPGPYGNMIGSQVYGRDGNSLGTLSSVVTDPQTGQPLYGVISTGGILGIGAQDHPVPWQLFSFSPNGVRVDMDQNRLSSAPGYNSGNSPDLLNNHWQRRLSDYYGEQAMQGSYGPNQGLSGQDPFVRLFNSNDIESVRGTVTQVYRHTQGDFTQVLIQTGNGRSIIAVLAPDSYLQNAGAEPQQGDTIRVRGSRTFQNGREFLIAMGMRVGNQHLRLRNHDGMPLWNQQQFGPQQGPVSPGQYQNGY